ncbi:hypothetical protein DFJ74DRAFT_710531 [Hyaloraphidium curvatum]|nr:hypothetical protein DFJ74DRAFT_710531 [Hyaloraphidium curvatum]
MKAFGKKETEWTALLPVTTARKTRRNGPLGAVLGIARLCLALVGLANICTFLASHAAHFAAKIESSTPELGPPVDILVVIFSHSNNSATRALSDLRLSRFPTTAPGVRLWAHESDPSRNLTFSYLYLLGNDSLVGPDPSLPPTFDEHRRILVAPVPGTYRMLSHRTRAMLLSGRRLGLPKHELLMKLDDDAFPCFRTVFSELEAKVSFRGREEKGKRKAASVWGGSPATASAMIYDMHPWYDKVYLDEVGWKKGDPSPAYPGMFFSGFMQLYGRELVARFEENAERLKTYAIEDGMVGVWMHRTLGLKRDEDYAPFPVGTKPRCDCANATLESGPEDPGWTWHGCKSWRQHAVCLGVTGDC